MRAMNTMHTLVTLVVAPLSPRTIPAQPELVIYDLESSSQPSNSTNYLSSSTSASTSATDTGNPASITAGTNHLTGDEGGNKGPSASTAIYLIIGSIVLMLILAASGMRSWRATRAAREARARHGRLIGDGEKPPRLWDMYVVPGGETWSGWKGIQPISAVESGLVTMGHAPFGFTADETLSGSVPASSPYPINLASPSLGITPHRDAHRLLRHMPSLSNTIRPFNTQNTPSRGKGETQTLVPLYPALDSRTVQTMQVTVFISMPSQFQCSRTESSEFPACVLGTALLPLRDSES